MKRLLQFRKREGTINHELLLRLGRELEARCSKTEGTGHSFIHPDDVGDVLQAKHLRELFSSFSWYSEDDRVFLYQSMRLIICILILMRWEDWEQFHAYFFYPVPGFRRPRYTDEKLPILNADFFEQAPPDFSRSFLLHQYTFKPVFIHENSHLKYSTDHRLPFLQIVRLQDIDSAQGVVERVRIERRFLYYANQTFNHSPQVMACKRITARTPEGKLNFNAEQRILEQFKSCITDNKNIMQSFASFIHGSDFIILSLWADGRDLNLFLTRPDEILDHYMARSIRFSPDNLLTEAYNLARALNFLHHEMVTTRGKQLRCAHLDLKPENVLVFFPPEDRANEAPVGRWKISDFGLSKVEEAVTEDRVLPISKDVQEASTAPGNIARELSFQPPTRGAGPFQPPEVQNTEAAKVNTRRDVWSYGCILAMVLAFALGGSAEVENQTRRRSLGGDDYFYRRTNRRSRPGPESMAHNIDAELKPAFRKWVEQASKLADERHGQWIQYTSNLILTLLDINIITRPEIMLAVETLHKITDFTETLAAHRLWGFDDDSRQPEPKLVPPPESSPGQLGDGTPFLPPSNYSPPSSTSHRAIRRRSPRLGSQRSSAASSIFFTTDPSLSFVRLLPPDRCRGATIEPLGNAAALWSHRDVWLYTLSSLHTEPAIWSERPTSTHIELEPLCFDNVFLPETSMCCKVQLAGKWIALLEQLTQSTFCICVYQRVALQQAKHYLRSRFTLPQVPQDFKISSRGTLAVRFRDRVEIHTRTGSTSVPFEKDFSAMAFSLNGQYFCLWERDPRGKGHAAWNYWTVWSQGTNDTNVELTVMGDTITCQLPNYTPGTVSEILLIPFSTYPRFIACDRQQYFYLVRADSQNARAHRIAQIDNVRAGFILPDDENFMLVRGSQHDSQGVEKCLMSFMESPSIQKVSCGKLHKNIDLEEDGAAVVPFDHLGGSPCLLTLQHSGQLVRKVL